MYVCELGAKGYQSDAMRKPRPNKKYIFFTHVIIFENSNKYAEGYVSISYYFKYFKYAKG